MIRRGLLGRCPRCGQGALIGGFLRIPERCSVCGLDYGFGDSGDGPVPFVILIVGGILVGGALALEVSYSPALWVHLLIWIPLGLVLGAILLRAFKGVLIALQWGNDAGERRYGGGER